MTDDPILVLNSAIGQLKDLRERILDLEDDSRSAYENLPLDLPPLVEALDGSVLHKLAESDLAIGTGVDVTQTDDARLLNIDGIDEEALYEIRKHYPFRA